MVTTPEVLFAKLRACLGSEVRSYLTELREHALKCSQSPEFLYHVDAAIRASAHTIYYRLGETAEISAALECGEDIISYGSDQIVNRSQVHQMDSHGRMHASDRSLLSLFDEVLEQLTPGRVRFCAREGCEKLFYATKIEKWGCSLKCADVLRHQRKKECETETKVSEEQRL